MTNLLFKLLRKSVKVLSGKGFNKIPGTVALYNFIYRKVKPSINEIEIDGIKMHVNSKDEGIVKPLLIHGAYEKYETELFKSLVTPRTVVVDIGANFGYYSLIAAKLVGDKGKVYAFEPEPNNFELLVKNVKTNHYENITPIKKALSDKVGKMKLFTEKFNLGGPSFCESNVLEKEDTIEVETTTLDEFFKDMQVDLIKMDVQGAEGFIFKGAKSLLQRNHLKIIIEFWPFGLINLKTDPEKLLLNLQKYGFGIKYIDEQNSNARPVEIKEIFELCQKSRNPQSNYVNLLLEKQ